MEAFEQSVLSLTAPLVVSYIALLGFGYLLHDFRQWRHRKPTGSALTIRDIVAHPTGFTVAKTPSAPRVERRASLDSSNYRSASASNSTAVDSSLDPHGSAPRAH